MPQRKLCIFSRSGCSRASELGRFALESILPRRLLVVILLAGVMTFPASDAQSSADPRVCTPTPKAELRKRMGSNFNQRYLSEDKPNDIGFGNAPGSERLESSETNGYIQSDTLSRQQRQSTPRFAVEPNFRRLVADRELGKDLHSLKKHYPRHLAQWLSARTEPVSSESSGEGESAFSELLAPTAQQRSQYEREPGGHARIRHKTRRHEQHNAAANRPRTELDMLDEATRKLREQRKKRSAAMEPWACEQTEHWIYLGQDYYPPYVRNLTCGEGHCYYGRGTCEGRAFTLFVLRRLSDKCVEQSTVDGDLQTELERQQLAGGQSTAPELQAQGRRFVEPWVFEELAVNFCCECKMLRTGSK